MTLYAFDMILSRKTQLAVVSYHSISDDSWRYGVSLAALEKQLTYLSCHFEFLSLDDLTHILDKKRKPQKPSVVITFDDGYEDILTAQKILKKYGVRPGIFVMAKPEAADRKELATMRPLLTFKQVESLQKKGFTIGCHSATHADFTNLSGKKLLDEVVRAKRQLEKILQKQIQYFAYPKGVYNAATVAAVKKAGFVLGLTMDGGALGVETNKLLLPRVGIDRSHSMLEFPALFSPSVIQFRGLVLQALRRSI